MKILVTGCAGFIGSHTVEYLLSQGVEVIGIDNFDNFYSREIKLQNLSASHVSPLFTFVEGDICSSSDLSNLPSGISGVIHLAARAGVRPSILNPEAYIHTNISGTQNILSWMGKRKIRNLVFASSSSVYGDVTPLPFREDALVAEPVSPYAWTKRCGELMTFTAHHLNQLSVVNLRIFTAYGPRQRPDLAIRKFQNLLSGERQFQSMEMEAQQEIIPSFRIWSWESGRPWFSLNKRNPCMKSSTSEVRTRFPCQNSSGLSERCWAVSRF